VSVSVVTLVEVASCPRSLPVENEVAVDASVSWTLYAPVAFSESLPVVRPTPGYWPGCQRSRRRWPGKVAKAATSCLIPSEPGAAATCRDRRIE
jgi:hypothetical protein